MFFGLDSQGLLADLGHFSKHSIQQLYVASQALISATFSMIKQSVVLDYFTRVKLVRTSTYKEGEVYSPEVNYILMIICASLFGDGKDLGNAFGVVDMWPV
ncbi:hypothetical protein IFM89_008153 [Coptis chinensis]|uniref:K+ potassium transporter integral membrane domain-containing protein n=1 Tax=Coptis chinensis TaxID=261450 RepID=A0A835ISC3_9MAGN|nr:hypothetical protein IFM89_008153 [Coptis chinensis]